MNAGSIIVGVLIVVYAFFGSYLWNCKVKGNCDGNANMEVVDNHDSDEVDKDKPKDNGEADIDKGHFTSNGSIIYANGKKLFSSDAAINFKSADFKANTEGDTKGMMDFIMNHLKDNPDHNIEITGFYKAEEAADVKFDLGEKRAGSIKEMLVKAGVDADKIIIGSAEKNDLAMTEDKQITNAIGYEFVAMAKEEDMDEPEMETLAENEKPKEPEMKENKEKKEKPKETNKPKETKTSSSNNNKSSSSSNNTKTTSTSSKSSSSGKVSSGYSGGTGTEITAGAARYGHGGYEKDRSGYYLDFSYHKLYFGSGKSDFTPDENDEKYFEKLKIYLENTPQSVAELVGHTYGGESESLGAKRAEAVKQKLVDMGIPASQLVVKSDGNDRPISSSGKKNRRVEILIENKN